MTLSATKPKKNTHLLYKYIAKNKSHSDAGLHFPHNHIKCKYKSILWALNFSFLLLSYFDATLNINLIGLSQNKLFNYMNWLFYRIINTPFNVNLCFCMLFIFFYCYTTNDKWYSIMLVRTTLSSLFLCSPALSRMKTAKRTINGFWVLSKNKQ